MNSLIGHVFVKYTGRVIIANFWVTTRFSVNCRWKTRESLSDPWVYLNPLTRSISDDHDVVMVKKIKISHAQLLALSFLSFMVHSDRVKVILCCYFPLLLNDIV